MPTWLLVGASVRALAASAARCRAAPRLVAVDLFGDRDLRALAEWHPPADAARRPTLRGCVSTAARVVAAGGIDAVVPAGGMEHHAAPLARAVGPVPVLASDPRAVAAVRDPGRLFAAARAAGLPYPRTWLPPDRVPADAGPCLLKPRRGGGGRGIRPWRPGRPVPRGAVVQARAGGVPVGAAAAGDGRGARLLGVALGLAGPALGAPPFAYAGSLVGPVLGGATAAVGRAAEAAVDRLAAAFALSGLFGVDFLLDGARLLLVEVNPRYTASMELIEAATGDPLLDLHLDGVGGRLPDAPPLWRRLLEGPVVGKGVVYASRPARAPDTSPWLAAGWRDVPPSGAALPAGDPVCSVFAAGRDVEATLAALGREAAAVRAALGPW